CWRRRTPGRSPLRCASALRRRRSAPSGAGSGPCWLSCSSRSFPCRSRPSGTLPAPLPRGAAGSGNCLGRRPGGPVPSMVTEAAALPVAFALVREDSLLDLEVLGRAGPGARVILIASGGCTAAALAASPNIGLLHLVDPNPAQLALCRLKLHLLRTAEPAARL